MLGLWEDAHFNEAMRSAALRVEGVRVRGLMLLRVLIPIAADFGEDCGVTRTLDAAGFDAAGFEAAGFEAAGFEAAGFEAAGSDAAGSDAAGSDAAGSDAAGSDAAGSDAAGSDAAGSDAAGSELWAWARGACTQVLSCFVLCVLCRGACTRSFTGNVFHKYFAYFEDKRHGPASWRCTVLKSAYEESLDAPRKAYSYVAWTLACLHHLSLSTAKEQEQENSFTLLIHCS